MASYRRCAHLILACLLLSACGAESQGGPAPNRRGPSGLVAFALPEGWTDSRFNDGQHFTRPGTDDPTVLAVVATPRDTSQSVAAFLAERRGVHAAQHHVPITDEMLAFNQFQVWHAFYEGRWREQKLMLDHYYLFSDALQVEVYLNTSEPTYQSYLPDLLTVVRSVRAVRSD